VLGGGAIWEEREDERGGGGGGGFISMAEAARHPVYRRMMRRGIPVAESGRKDLLVTMPNPRPM